MVAPDHTLDDILLIPVAEALRRWPAAAEAFIALRMACVGCAFSEFDTIQQALEAHHIHRGRMLAALRSIREPRSSTALAPGRFGGTR